MFKQRCKQIFTRVLDILGLYKFARLAHGRLTSKPHIHLTHSGIYKTAAQRSVVFLNNSYYHFYYLAQALRRRDWDVVTVSVEDPNSANHLYYHGEDINLYSANYYDFRRNIDCFFKTAVKRFKLLHFANDHVMSFYPENYNQEHPADIIEWKRQGNKLAYTISGCNSGISQTALAKWSRTNTEIAVCEICPYQKNGKVCSDEKNLRWSRSIERYCDVIFGEQLPALDAMALKTAIREPVTMCLDPIVWHPELDIPIEYKISRKQDEILIYHAVGNYNARTLNGRNIKGTSAVLSAIEQLQQEGFPVRLIFATDKRNKELRYTQVQADIIVDQLNIGRYGATSREAMMLGKPTICYLNRNEFHPQFHLQSLEEAPLVSASEATLYAVLKDLCADKEKRQMLGKKSREFALKWHSADACAERYEKIYDQIMRGESLCFPQDWSYFEYAKVSV